MTKDEAHVLLPRFLNAVTTMAASADLSRKARLAWVINDVLVFVDNEILKDLTEYWRELRELASEASVPKNACEHPYYPKTVSSYYLTAKKNERLTSLLIVMFEAIVFTAYQD